MFLPLLRPARLLAAVVSVVFVLVSGAAGQDSQSAPPSEQSGETHPTPVQAPLPQQFVLKDYSKAHSHFPNPIAPYLPSHVAAPNLSNTPRIDELLHDGKLMLSMDDAVALALENNLDIAIARYNLNIADTDILRAKAGANTLGINSGLVQGTPGGTPGGLGGSIGSGPGGTTVGVGGAGTGAFGLVTSTLGSGPTITSFDPVISGTLQFDHNNILSSSAFAVPVTTQNTTTADFAYLQGFQWGTNLSVGFNNNRITTSSPFASLSPNLNSNFQARVTQHLLQGFGLAPNNRFIRIAKNNREISDVAFRLQVITTVDQIENIYWDLVYAYENVRVQQESLAFAQKTLSDTQKQVQIGTLAPIEVVRAQSTAATDQQALTVAQTNLDLQQLLMKNALSRTLVDPNLADAQVVPTSTMQLPAQEAVVPTQDLVSDALSHRAELAEARINLTNTEISNKAIRNALLPTLDLFAYYGGAGLGGSQNAASLCPPLPATQPFGCRPAPGVSPVSYGSTLNDLVNSTAPDKGVGLTLNIPLRNRVAQATQIRSELEYRQAQMRLQQIENQVRIEVRNAQFALQQNRASVQAAQAAAELGRQSLDAEQKKLALGASTTTLVLQNRSALATAESTLVSAMAAYEKSRVEMERATGRLLDDTGILVADAERGQVTHMPNVPDIAPRKTLPQVQTPNPVPGPSASPLASPEVPQQSSPETSPQSPPATPPQ
ncbi:MAG: TolC family protein [Acidobacteriales bacterium]|nr:TolC family protein [Terriglobales bacterium]